MMQGRGAREHATWLCAGNAARAALTVVVAVALACGQVAFAPVAALAAPSAQLESDLEAAKRELAELTEELESAQADAEATEQELAETQERITELEGEITATEAELTEARSSLSEHISSSYKSGRVSLLEIVLSATSFEDLTSRMYYASKVSEAQNDRIEGVCQLQNELESQREELSEREASLTKLHDEQAQTAAALESSLTDARSYMNGLSSELRDALAAEREAAADAVDDAQDTQDGSNNNGGGNREPSQPSSPDTPSKPSGGGGGSSGGGSANPGNLTTAQRNTIVSAAKSQVGVDYDYGAMSPGVAFDCSGLTTYAYRCAGLSIPRSSRTQYNQVKSKGNLKTSTSALVAGDLVFYGSGSVSHVAVYIGGGQVCHASNYGVGVIISNVNYRSGFMGGGSPI